MMMIASKRVSCFPLWLLEYMKSMVWLFNRRNMMVAAKFIYGLVFQVDSQCGWPKVGESLVPYDVNVPWDDQISIEREAFAWTQKQIIQEGRELSKLPKAGDG